MTGKTYLRLGGGYGLFGAKPVAGVTALAAQTLEQAIAESDVITTDANAGFQGTWSGGFDIYEVDRTIAPGPLTAAGAACLADLPQGARFVKRYHRGGTNV